MGHSQPLFLYFRLFKTVEVNVSYKFFPMTGFELRTSGIGSDHRSTNWATTTAHYAFLLICFSRGLTSRSYLFIYLRLKLFSTFLTQITSSLWHSIFKQKRGSRDDDGDDDDNERHLRRSGKLSGQILQNVNTRDVCSCFCCLFRKMGHSKHLLGYLLYSQQIISKH